MNYKILTCLLLFSFVPVSKAERIKIYYLPVIAENLNWKSINGIHIRGGWEYHKKYTTGDVVTYFGSFYITENGKEWVCLGSESDLKLIESYANR
jgi:hypothetical protein